MLGTDFAATNESAFAANRSTGTADAVARSRRDTVLGIAQRAFATGHREDAAWICDCLLREDPMDAVAAILRFDIHVSLYEYEKAYDLIGRFIRPHSDSDILLRAAFAAAYTGRPRPEMKRFCDGYLASLGPALSADMAASRSSKALKLSASLALGIEAHMSLQDYVALQYLKLAVKEDPSNPKAALMLGNIYEAQRDFALALDALIKGRSRMSFEESRPADIRIRQLRRMVNAESQTMRPSEADSHFKRADGSRPQVS